MKEYFLWLAKVMTLVVVFGFFVPLFFVMAIAAAGSGSKLDTSVGEKRVAVVELSGVIEDSKKVLKELYKNVDNDDVVGVVLRINSPGGAVGPSQEIYRAVQKLKELKPIVASMGNVAASGGLYSALGASKVFAQPGTITGSIGVILQIPNFSQITSKYGFEMVTIKAGKLKDAGNVFRPMKDNERAYFQDTASAAHEDFMQAVSDGRGIPMEDVRKFADGRIILGSRALKLKVIDEYGDLYDAARAVHELSGEPLEEGVLPKLKYPSEGYEERLKQLLENATYWLPRQSQSFVKLMYLLQ